MSAPKRLHEESGHSTPLKRPFEETSIFSNPGKQNQLVNHDFHLPFEYGQDGRLAKVQRIEPREIDKRAYHLHRLPSASASSLDYQITSENRLDLKSSKDDIDVKNDNREMKADNRDLFTDMKKDSLVGKAESDIKLDTRADGKEIRIDRGPHGDHRVDLKFEKDNNSGAASHLTSRDSKEQPRGKKFCEPPTDNSDSWHAARGSLQSNNEVPKDLSTAVERDTTETQEAVGENKVDLKAEDKFRDKDRRRSRDFGEKEKDKSDRRTNMQQGAPAIDRKEVLREERDVEKRERDKKDALKGKNAIEKYSVKRELASEKGISLLEKESTDGSIRISEQENTTTDSKKLKDDNGKSHDTEGKEKKRERDIDSGDRHEQHGIDDAGLEGDGATEKEKEASGGVQHRKRMARSRATPQAFHREHRFRSRVRDSEGSQGKPETPAVLYKAGECMQELLKSWKEFEGSQDNKSDESVQSGPTLDIRIPAECVTSTNRQVKGAQLWGTDVYTNDSDLVAVLMHTGYCCPTSSPPPPAIQEFRATIRVLPPRDIYTSSLRNNVRSRAWGAGIGCSFRVERCCIVKNGGGTIDLEPRLTHNSAVEPTLAPVSVERTMTTRAAASNALRQQKFVREVTIQYNLWNEPWLKYALNIVSDKGLKKPLYTSARLKKGEVLYLETHFNRYELCFNGEKALYNGSLSGSSHAQETENEKLQNNSLHGQNGERCSSDRDNIVDTFRWSRCKKAFPEKIMRSLGIPLPLEHLEVLEEKLDWEDINWSQTGVWVAGKEYALARAHFLSPN